MSQVSNRKENAYLREESNPFVLRLPHRQLKSISSSFWLEMRFLDALITSFCKITSFLFHSVAVLRRESWWFAHISHMSWQHSDTLWIRFCNLNWGMISKLPRNLCWLAVQWHIVKYKWWNVSRLGSYSLSCIHLCKPHFSERETSGDKLTMKYSG